MDKLLLMIAGTLAGSACTATNNAPPINVPPAQNGSACDAANGQAFLGTEATQELGVAILSATGSRILRWVPPRTPVTKDYRTDRVSISYDDQRIITAVNCG